MRISQASFSAVVALAASNPCFSFPFLFTSLALLMSCLRYSSFFCLAVVGLRTFPGLAWTSSMPACSKVPRPRPGHRVIARSVRLRTGTVASPPWSAWWYTCGPVCNPDFFILSLSSVQPAPDIIWCPWISGITTFTVWPVLGAMVTLLMTYTS